MALLECPCRPHAWGLWAEHTLVVMVPAFSETVSTLVTPLWGAGEPTQAWAWPDSTRLVHTAAPSPASIHRCQPHSGMQCCLPVCVYFPEFIQNRHFGFMFQRGYFSFGVLLLLVLAPTTGGVHTVK